MGFGSKSVTSGLELEFSLLCYLNIMFYFFLFLTKDLSILLIKDHEHKALTSQNIKLCKIITTCYEVTKS
jgi:hypothetical protein